MTTAPAFTPRSTAPGLAETSSATRPSTAVPSTTTEGSPSCPRSLSAASGIAFASGNSRPGHEHLHARDLARRVGGDRRRGRRRARAQLPGQLAALRLAVRDRLRDVLRRGPQRRGGLAEHAVVVAQQVDRDGAGDRLDAPHVRRARGLRGDLEDADLGRGPDVRAAAQLARPGAVPHLDHADDVAVLLAEERGGAERLGLLERRRDRADRVVLEDPAVDALLDVAHLLRGERLWSA